MNPRLEQWFNATFNGEDVLVGYVYNHPRQNQESLADGHRVVTSKLLEIDRKNKKLITENTEYDMGEEKLMKETPVMTFMLLEQYLPRLTT